MNLPKCKHGNEGAMVEYPDPHGRVEVSGGYCDCRVIVDWDFQTHEMVTEAATRAWAALCAPVTDERLREIVRECGFDGVVCLPDEYALDVARAVRDACEGKP